ncbi:TENA/THI-4/PQQC family protein [Clavispora lusitaniae]|uniref:TENA/THI-4/PQQC family protein n=1 Tax=Clavispora lusitaniae TaxID=36911 RepID=UPI0016909884|nr:hypothetical protein E0198_003597 [Clavispora lusitaniae]KAF7582159.1 TENA/THI-4/PQQC family protein [Clavispora lusitaniae]
MSFVQELHEKFSKEFNVSVSHPLTNELCHGTLPDYKLYTYLVQDLKFFQDGLKIFGAALTHCDDKDAAIVLGKQIGFVCNDENTYFHTCLDQLRKDSTSELQAHVPDMVTSAPVLPGTKKYLNELERLAFCQDYPTIITSMYVMEKCYLGWVVHNGKLPKLEYKHQEWVNLHSGPEFAAWVDFLASEVDRVGKNEDRKKRMTTAFASTVQLEIDFFEACYNYGQ